MPAASQNHASGAVLPPGAQLGRYEVLSKLAAGGMAVVYAARLHGIAGFQRMVALKVLHANLAHEEEFIAMFLDEARLAARIRHPNVVSTIEISDSLGAGYYLVMEYIEGDHLGRLLAAAHKESERLPVPIVLRIVTDALAGLAAAHDLTDDTGRRVNLVHRDVSPHNIMVGTDGVARLTDFGVAKAEDRRTHTRDGQVKGKLAYMAPEQASTGQADQRSDLFAMGVILWECLTGRRLFRAGNAAATLNKLINGSIPPPSSIDSGLEPVDEILQRALHREPESRFQEAEAFISAIERAAPVLGGIASQREVGRMVKRLAEEKLTRDQRVIRSAERVVDRLAEGDELSSEPSASSRSAASSLSQSASRATGSSSRASAIDGARIPTGSHRFSLPPPPPMGPVRTPAAMGSSARASQAGLVLRWGVLVAGIFACAAVAWLSVSLQERVIVTPIPVEGRSGRIGAGLSSESEGSRGWAESLAAPAQAQPPDLPSPEPVDPVTSAHAAAATDGISGSIGKPSDMNRGGETLVSGSGQAGDGAEVAAMASAFTDEGAQEPDSTGSADAPLAEGPAPITKAPPQLSETGTARRRPGVTRRKRSARRAPKRSRGATSALPVLDNPYER